MTQHLSICAALSFAVAPTLALSCPTVADLDAGGLAFTVDGEGEYHRRAANGLIVVDSQAAADGYVSRSVLAHGVHVVHLVDLQDGVVQQDTAWRFVFEKQLDNLPVPQPDKTMTLRSWSLEGVLRGEEEVIAHTWGPQTSYSIGACTYDAIPVRADYDGESYDHFEELMYLPALETAILVSYGDVDGTDQYSYTAVQAN